MDEAEALSTKMAIMVKGGIFKCFGSSQHIKSKYSTGFVIEIKIRTLDEKDLESQAHEGSVYGLSSEIQNLIQAST
jgi:ABC-type multidrug transport system ATPase subunit